MRSLKNTGCLSRGSGYNEVMQNCWTLQDYTELAYTSPQHKAVSKEMLLISINEDMDCNVLTLHS
ncbi:hypothetical protein DPMN_123544 [Dreissena polymorpha]|uniref:Uncharacterized protein n=1 Tax=Dreissena polymorpha TaxID=45954 RepID=A0A9D4GQJ6_DREPO|nr:hypothetical protein DPMN_123544 [Dreissena polymorpha]